MKNYNLLYKVILPISTIVSSFSFLSTNTQLDHNLKSPSYRHKTHVLFSIAKNNYHNTSLHKESNTDLSKKIIQALSNKSKKTWKRLYPLIHLSSLNNTTQSTAIDIGCDHGLLTLGLATSLHTKYNKIIGVDSSIAALQSGILYNYAKIQNTYPMNMLFEEITQNMIFDIRLGDGLGTSTSLLNLTIDEEESFDSIFISGMGINTMMDIIQENLLPKVNCNEMYIQPVSSKPRKLIHLYDFLHTQGFVCRNEVISKVGKRFYISSCFLRGSTMVMPGTFLLEQEVYSEYVAFHKRWVEKDREVVGFYHEGDLRWLHSDPVRYFVDSLQK